MNSAEQSERDGRFFSEMRESAPDDLDLPAVQPASLTGILLSPFASPYPTQRTGSNPLPGLTGELRGYYHRSDGVDRWKPSWSNFDHPRSGNRHKGVDIYAPIGTDIVAISDGYAVLYPNPTPGDDLGIKIGMTITGSDGTKYDVLYGHLSSLNGVTRAVRKGDILGKTGCSGNAEDGTCSIANRCGGFSSHLHVAVRESKSGAQYVDPVLLFNWRLGYANDNRDVPCDQAFTAKMLEHFENGGGDISSADLMDAAIHAGPSKSYKLAFFGETISSDGEARLIIFENLLITLKVMLTGPFPGVMVSIKGRQRMFFHPSLAPQISYALTASFENVDSDGNSTGDTVHVPLVTIKGETISDTGLRTLWVDTLVRGVTLDLDKPVKFLGTILEAV